MRELKDVKVQLISILFDDFLPSNEEGVIIKSANKKIEVEVVKQDNIKGQLECNVMIANKVDTQGDFYSNETVEKAQVEYLDYLVETLGKNEPSDTNHNFEVAKGVKLTAIWTDKTTENWIFKAILDISGNEVLMEKAKTQKITGVSIYGKALAEDQEKGMIKGIYDMIKSLFDKKEITKESNMTKEELKSLIDTDEGKQMLTEFGYIPKPAEVEPQKTDEIVEPEAPKKEETPEETIDTEKEDLKKQVTELKEKIETLEKAQSTSEGTIETVPKTFDEVVAEKMAEKMKKYKE